MPYRMPGTRTVIDYAGASVTGRRREINEDAWGAVESASVFVVADGSGAESSGRLAADLSVTSVRRFFSGQNAGFSGHGGPPAACDPLAAAILEANAPIAMNAIGDSAGMSSTVVALRLAPPWLAVVSVGDCRLYRYRRGYDPTTHRTADARGGELRRLTLDDVLPFEVWRSGATFTECAEIDRAHPNVITRVLGHTPQVSVTVGYHALAPSDVYLLCSDGVTRQLDDGTIREIISRDEDALADRCDLLVQTADEHGGDDNVTAVLLHVVA